MTLDNSPLIEYHPWQPFLPPTARLLMLGSFPARSHRWSMDFYYPNFQNDMWRIIGLLFFGQKDYFVDGKKFDQARIMAFCEAHGLAMADSARAVIRKRGNASDQHLQVVEPLDLEAALASLPACQGLCVTGGKAAETVAAMCPALMPVLKNKGWHTTLEIGARTYEFFRMPSSSRAYPKPIEEKAVMYRQMFEALGMLPPLR